MTQNLIIIGTSGSALDALDIVEAINATGKQWLVKGFLDDVAPPGKLIYGVPVLGPIQSASRHGDAMFLNTIGSDKSFRNRPDIITRSGIDADKFATLVHPGASVSSRAELGRGICVNYGVSIGGRVTLGDHVQLGPGCIIGHDTTIGEYTLIAPGAIVSGFVRIGRCSYVGAGAMVRQKQIIGDGALVGMGAVVTLDVSEGQTVIGNPAAPFRRRSSEQDAHLTSTLAV